jgi:hypothetical protein
VGDVVASIKCAKGAPTIADWIWHEKIASTQAVAARFCMRTPDALAALKRLERQGKVQRIEPECGYDRNVAWWTAEICELETV